MCRCEVVEEVPVECAAVLSSTTLFAPGTPVITEGPDAVLAEIGRINESPGLAMCGELINTLYCIIRYPPCGDTGLLRPICASSAASTCNMINDQILQCWNSLSSVGSYPITTEFLSSGLMCEQSETFYGFPPRYISPNNDCISKSCNITYAYAYKVIAYTYM